jgi:hypothetical protein
MYGMGGMAKNALKNAFISKSNTKTKPTVNNEKQPLGHIEKRSAARSIVNYENTPISYRPPRIQQSDKSSNIFKGADFTGCSYNGGTINESVLTNCIIDGTNILQNLDLEFTDIKVTGLATINQLKLTRSAGNIIPAVTSSYDLGSTSLKWNNIYGKYIDACYGFYIGGTTNYFTIIRTSDSSDTVMTHSMGDLIIDNTVTTGTTITRLGTDTSATSYQVQNNSESSLFSVDGSGQVDIGGNLDVSGGINIDADNQAFTIGTGSDLSITHTGANTSITSITGDLLIDNTSTTGATVVQLGTDTSATAFQVKNNSSTVLFKVEGDGTTTSAGRFLVDDETQATNTTDGSLQTDGGLSVVKNAYIGQNVIVVGTATANQFIMSSDRRLKKQIKELDKEYDDDDLDNKFENLEPVKFKWKKQAKISNIHAKSNIHNTKEKYQYGLIAQNVLREFPECAFEKPDGHLGIDYMGLTSVLILKIQKQNKELKDKDYKIDYLENTVKKQEIVLNNILQRMERLEDMNDCTSNGSHTSGPININKSWDQYDRDRNNGGNHGGNNGGNHGGNHGGNYGSYGSNGGGGGKF